MVSDSSLRVSLYGGSVKVANELRLQLKRKVFGYWDDFDHLKFDLHALAVELERPGIMPRH
jgi:hypothetical protein